MDDARDATGERMEELTPKEAAVILGLSDDTVVRLLKSGELGGVDKTAGLHRSKFKTNRKYIDEFLAQRSNRTIRTIRK